MCNKRFTPGTYYGTLSVRKIVAYKKGKLNTIDMGFTSRLIGTA